MATHLRQTLGDYCKMTDVGQILLGFQPDNPVTFDIKNFVLSGLKDNQVEGKAIKDHWEHLAKLHETCLMCKPSGDTTDD